MGCGQRRVAYRRVDGGILCQTCDIKHGYTTRACERCGQIAPLLRGACAACQLRARVDQLAASAGPEIAATLAPFLRELARAENPSSMMRWFCCPGFADHPPDCSPATSRSATPGLTRPRLRRRTRSRSSVQSSWPAGSSIPAMKPVLGSLPGRPWRCCRSRRAPIVPMSSAYATWQVAHQLAHTVKRRGEATPASVKYARSLASEAIKLVVWLHDQQLELADLRQDLIDEWVAGGSRMRRRVRLFLAWLQRAKVTGALHVDWDDRLPARPAIDDEQRFAILRRLLHDPEIDPRDRFAGSVLLLYGKPITQIAALSTTDIHTTPDGEITLRLGRGDIPLPEPLAQVAQGVARPAASADRHRRVADPRPACRAPHHRGHAAPSAQAIRDRS